MSSDQDYQFTRALSLSELIGLSFKLLFSNIFIWVFYLLAFLLFTLYLFTIKDLGFSTSLDVDFSELLGSIDFTDPNTDTNELLNLSNKILFTFFTESLVISVFLSIAYAITLFVVKSNFERVLPNNLLIKTVPNDMSETKSLITKLKISISKVIPKLIPIVIAAFILNFLTLIGLIFFIVPGIIISGLVSLVPVIILSESDISVGKSFKRSYELVKGFLLKTLALLVFIGIIQFILATIVQLILVNIYVVFSGIDPEQISTSTDPIFVILRYVSEAFFAPLSIISLILFYYNLKWENQQKYSQPWNVPIQNQPIQPYPQYQQIQPSQQSYQPQTENIVPPHEKSIFCISCGKANPIYGSFCAFCGKKLLKSSETSTNIGNNSENLDLNKIVCSTCGKPPRKPEDKFCAYCGMKY
ncbi:MAG: hypothetical protein HeimC3_02870 [Candidatus Heimdallarchaeota archaeon LC_3]|nr:MAG: hypothetical protein HeimC3_02870 [Candidatus Heimdallarchaeota archaeon LC_3]